MGVTANRTILIPLKQPSQTQHQQLQNTFQQYNYARKQACDYCWDNPKQPDDLETYKGNVEQALYQQVKNNTELHANLVQKAFKDVTDVMSTLKTTWEKNEQVSKPNWDGSWNMTYDKRAATYQKHKPVSLH